MVMSDSLKFGSVFFLVICTLLFFGMDRSNKQYETMTLTNQPRATATDSAYSQAAIKLCWKEYERKSATPGEKRSIAATCEMMERGNR
jgi:hypothetical protein